ncbi:hypothetical protein O6H91_03G113700 [Diphasiastrum complanatum]|uniref:Uncharacterized protein n=1 Tax=Diphasiastrum complanatum TaxID=34168 RepID=A0ACC2EA83_DIPCM|nr:hypothetical protein O6H91_03G113700 [Diphasiastrum complanatum]
MACSCSSVPPQWRHLLSNALQANQHLKHSRYLQLATVRANGSPANRTIVFRGFVEGTDKLQFTTDSRSQKATPLPLSVKDFSKSLFRSTKSSFALRICYYFTDTWEQFRIHGLLEIIGKSETDMNKKLIREKAWFSSSSKSRMQFAGPHPGLPVVASQDDHEPELDSEQGPVDCFCVVTLEPEEVDYVHLKDNKRWVYTRSKKENEEAYFWFEIELTP